MSSVLKLILEGEALETTQMATILGMTREEVESELGRLKREGKLLGFRAILGPDVDTDEVQAVIEVKIAPERDGGFDRIAERISRFDQVDSCYLMSGTYDLLVFMRAQNLKRVAQFVYEKLATINGVQSTATHFMLRAYKESGFVVPRAAADEGKPAISP